MDQDRDIQQPLKFKNMKSEFKMDKYFFVNNCVKNIFMRT